MPFSSPLFLHLFLPAFLAVYWLTPRAASNYTAIGASLVFYAWGGAAVSAAFLGNDLYVLDLLESYYGATDSFIDHFLDELGSELR